ncbi:MAG: ParB/RepB/Spo0J family partition protein [Rickettsiaceae bacterium]|nr:ParB/RepB/Spo0J family partition protein [Rickettsiaceae bacterium]
MHNKKLGKGLSALFSVNNLPESEQESSSILSLPINLIIQDSSQPRKYFDNSSIEELALSIKQHGVLQPIIVKKITDDNYLLIAGERRWRAANLAGLEEIPVIIKDISDAESFTIALIENLQRENLNPLEESEGYERLIEIYKYKQDELAQILGKSRSHVNNILRLSKLSPNAKSALIDGTITLGHAKILLSAEDQDKVLAEILRKNLNVRATDKLVKRFLSTSNILEKSSTRSKKNLVNENLDADLLEIVSGLSKKFGVDVIMQKTSEDSGKIIINFNNLEELDTILLHITASK